jgi:hypothetical protein
MTPLEQLLALVRTHDWLPLVLLSTMIVRKWLSGESKFPISIPKTWQPTVTAAGGLVYGAMLAVQAGQTLGAALLDMAITAGAGGFLDGMLVAIFDHDNAPVWARSLVLIFDDLTGHTPTHGAAAVRVAKSIHPPPLPPASILPDVNPQPSIPISVKPSEPPLRKVGLDFSMGGFSSIIPAFCLLCALVVASVLPSGCTGKPPGPNTPADIGGVVACVIADVLANRSPIDCVQQYGQALVDDVIPMLRHSKTFTAEHPEALPALLSYRTAAPILP